MHGSDLMVHVGDFEVGALAGWLSMTADEDVGGEGGGASEKQVGQEGRRPLLALLRMSSSRKTLQLEQQVSYRAIRSLHIALQGSC